MTTFDKRDQGFENKFAHDAELSFKANALRNKLLGLWAAEKLGKKGEDAQNYAREMVLLEIEGGKVAERIGKDFAALKVNISAKNIHKEAEHLLIVARKQLLGEAS